MNLPVWILLTICIVGWGLWGFLEKLAIKNSSLFMVQLFGTIAFLACVIVSYFFGKSDEQSHITLSGAAYSSLASICSFLAGLSCLIAMKNLDANYVIGITSVSPVITFIMCAWILGENITILKALGIIVVVLGIILVSI